MAETTGPGTTGRAQRAQMDIETFKGLLVINGGGPSRSFRLAAILHKLGDAQVKVTPLIHALLWAVMFMGTSKNSCFSRPVRI